jgi:hypothetical protein
MSSCTAYQVCILFVLVSIIRGISGTNQVVEYQGNNYNVEITCADEPVLPWCYSSVGGWAQCGNQPTNDAFKLAAQCTPVPCKTQFSYNGITYDNSCSCDNHHISWCYKANGGWKDCGLMEKLQGMSNVYDQCEPVRADGTSKPKGAQVAGGRGREKGSQDSGSSRQGPPENTLWTLTRSAGSPAQADGQVAKERNTRKGGPTGKSRDHHSPPVGLNGKPERTQGTTSNQVP